MFDARVRWGQSHRSGQKWPIRVREESAESRARRGKWGTLLNRLDKPTLRRQPDASMKARDIGPLCHPSGGANWGTQGVRACPTAHTRSGWSLDTRSFQQTDGGGCSLHTTAVVPAITQKERAKWQQTTRL